MVLQKKWLKMKFLTEKDLEIFDEKNRLKAIADQKHNTWKIQADNARNFIEYDMTKPLFDEAMEASKKWYEHSEKHKAILRLDKMT